MRPDAIDREAFEQLVDEALDGLPDWVLEALENVALLVVDEDDEDEGLLGLYEGVALPDRAGGPPLEPARITLFRGPILRASRDVEGVREQVRVTVRHEVGHHLGLDEDRLEELGYG